MKLLTTSAAEGRKKRKKNELTDEQKALVRELIYLTKKIDRGILGHFSENKYYDRWKRGVEEKLGL